MEKRETVICPGCGRVKSFGVFVTPTSHELQTIQMSGDLSIVKETCDLCSGLSVES